MNRYIVFCWSCNTACCFCCLTSTYIFIMKGLVTSRCSGKAPVVACAAERAKQWEFLLLFCSVLGVYLLLLFVLNPLVSEIFVGPGFCSELRRIWLERKAHENEKHLLDVHSYRFLSWIICCLSKDVAVVFFERATELFFLWLSTACTAFEVLPHNDP